mmetsp:Transcript_38619/g.93359  ORF Transcript_38619/g.93359 Transcript_38619/m.93359 type:complete len:425 (-) Transcript_38619:217-1491(-)
MDQLAKDNERSTSCSLKLLALVLVPGFFISLQNIRFSNTASTHSILQASMSYLEEVDAPRIRSLLGSSEQGKDGVVQTNSSSITSDQAVASQITDSEMGLLHDEPIPIEELIQHNTTCPDGLFPIENTHMPRSVTHLEGRRIPKIVHITSKHRCATSAVIKNVDKWRFKNYSVYFHDDNALHKLFTHPQTRKLFPTLREGLKCVTSGATKSDLWRYLVLYIYGGVYTDIDNSPNKFNGETIKPEDDSFFPLEGLGIMSQFFFASSPGHPLMRQMLETGVERLKTIPNVMINNPAQNTGPGACKVGFIRFMAEVGVETTGYINAGMFVGANNRSVTVVGTKEDSREYVDRGGLGNGNKMGYYKALGIKHFSEARKGTSPKGKISCKEHLKRTKGTDKVANYRYVKKFKKYIEVNTTTKGIYNLTY